MVIETTYDEPFETMEALAKGIPLILNKSKHFLKLSRDKSKETSEYFNKIIDLFMTFDLCRYREYKNTKELDEKGNIVTTVYYRVLHVPKMFFSLVRKEDVVRLQKVNIYRLLDELTSDDVLKYEKHGDPFRFNDCKAYRDLVKKYSL